MGTEERIIFGEPSLGDAEAAEVTDSLQSSWIGTGPKVAQFEEQFLAYKEAQYGVALSSCTAALHLSLLALELPPGSEVITSPLTFCATINAIIHAGAIPVLADIDPLTQNLNPQAVEDQITERTRAILPVHFAGRSCEMGQLQEIASRYQLDIVEDCAHAIESTYLDTPCGTLGRFGCFSFHATKNLTTGEGGFVICRDQEDAMRLRSLALHGLSSDAWRRYSDEGYQHYQVNELGFKYNMTDLQAAIGLPQLARLEENALKRLSIWQRYDASFSELPITLPQPPTAGHRHALHLYTILVDEEHTGLSRDEFLNRIDHLKIGTGVHYLSASEHPYYQNRFHWNEQTCPNAHRIGRQTVSLPLSPHLTEAQVDRVIFAVKKCLQR